MVVARPADVGVNNRRAVRRALVGGLPIELVIEDGANRAISERTDLDGACRGNLEPRDTERPRQTENAETGTEALLGMGPVLQDQVAKCGRCRPDQGRVPADAGDGPSGIAPMAGWHVIGDGGVFAITAAALVDGNAFAFGKYLDGAVGEADFDLDAGEAMGHAVEVLVDLNMVIDADPADAPLRKHIWFNGQRLEHGPIEFLEQLPARAAKPAQCPFLVDPLEQFSDGRIEIGACVSARPQSLSRQPLRPLSAH